MLAAALPVGPMPTIQRLVRIIQAFLTALTRGAGQKPSRARMFNSTRWLRQPR
jgi:hypothetical protein